MRELIYDKDGTAILKEGSKYYVRYDAGAHQIAIREDEISEAEAKQVMLGMPEATQVLIALQERLTRQGVNPYASNA